MSVNLRNNDGYFEYESRKYKIRYLILASDSPGTFNLGGDLDLFLKRYKENNKEAIVHYAESCVANVYNVYSGFSQLITTIALVQGDALGGGFEAALACDYIIAEESAKFGFPEIMFNLFPGMGAYSFLSRQLGHKRALELMHSPKVYTATEMKCKHLVDIVVPDGQGEDAVHDFIEQRRSKSNGLSSGPFLKKMVQNISHEELVMITHYWAECVFNLSEKDLRALNMLLYRQNKIADRQLVKSVA
jgi:DSF synthase